MKKILLILIFVIFITPVFAQDENYCKDKESWNEWNAMTIKFPKDIPLQILHALRIGLCVKIEENSITFEEATDLFKKMFDTVINKRGQEDKAKKQDDS